MRLKTKNHLSYKKWNNIPQFSVTSKAMPREIWQFSCGLSWLHYRQYTVTLLFTGLVADTDSCQIYESHRHSGKLTVDFHKNSMHQTFETTNAAFVRYIMSNSCIPSTAKFILHSSTLMLAKPRLGKNTKATAKPKGFEMLSCKSRSEMSVKSPRRQMFRQIFAGGFDAEHRG